MDAEAASYKLLRVVGNPTYEAALICGILSAGGIMIFGLACGMVMDR